MASADRFAQTYEQAVGAFQQQYGIQRKIFVGTKLGNYLRLLDDKVGEAVRLNQDSGWLPSGNRFTEEDFMLSLIRRDRWGKRYKKLAQVPEFLRGIFDEQYDEESFRAMADEIREACWSAYSGMQKIREEMDDAHRGWLA